MLPLIKKVLYRRFLQPGARFLGLQEWARSLVIWCNQTRLWWEDVLLLFFLFLFLTVENRSKENCKNLGTGRTWHEPPLSKALAWRFTEVGPSTTCASCGACTPAVPNPLVFIKLPNAVGNFNPKAAEELPSIHKKEAARRIIALPSRWQSMCMIKIQHTKFETHGGQDQENPSGQKMFLACTWP